MIEDLRAERQVDFPVPDYAPYDRIIETPTTRLESRWLVGGTLESDPQQENNYLNRK